VTLLTYSAGVTIRDAFNADEWSAIASAPVLAGMMVMAADRGGTVRETLSISRAYADARAAKDTGQLLAAVISSPPQMGQAGVRVDPQTLASDAPATLRRAIDLLEERATQDEVVEYKRFVYGLADGVARAHREGGVLGIGGKDVSEPEQEALDRIAGIFDAPVRVRGAAESAPRQSFTSDEARAAGDELGIDWDAAGFDVEQLRAGMDVELEHGRRSAALNLTDDDPVKTAKIAVAHLNELADYYTRLARLSD
jgi:hypothetical protein